MDESPTQADWQRWLEDHGSKFLLFARQETRREADAQDLVQEAVIFESVGRIDVCRDRRRTRYPGQHRGFALPLRD